MPKHLLIGSLCLAAYLVDSYLWQLAVELLERERLLGTARVTIDRTVKLSRRGYNAETVDGKGA